MASTVLKRKLGRPSKRQTAANRATVKKTTTTDAVAILHKRYVEGRPELEEYLVEERERILIGSRIYDLRTKAGMTQAALAKKIGTTASAICRLEDADYEGHSLPTLRKIAAVFGMRVELNFVPLKKSKTGRKTTTKSKAKS